MHRLDQFIFAALPFDLCCKRKYWRGREERRAGLKIHPSPFDSWNTNQMISPTRKWICAAAVLHHRSALHHYSKYDLLQLVWPFNAALSKSDTWGQEGGGERSSFLHLSLDILLHLFTASSICCQAAVTSELPQRWVSNKCFTGSVLCTMWWNTNRTGLVLTERPQHSRFRTRSYDSQQIWGNLCFTC